MIVKALKGNRLIRALGSVRLAFALFWAIIAISFAGAVAPEEVQPKILYSRWFAALLGLFALNILLCAFIGFSFSRKKAAAAIIHAAVLLVLAGALVSYLGSVRGVMELTEGQTKDTIVSGCALRRLGFAVMLEEFSLAWHANRPEAFELVVKVEEKNFRQQYALAMNQTQRIGATGYSVSVADYMPHFSLDEDMRPRNVSEMPRNPAVLVSIARGDFRENRWVFALHPQMGAKDTAIKLGFAWTPAIKEFRSALRVIDEKAGRTLSGETKVNAPFRYRGYTFYQAGYDDEDLTYTRLDVRRDPGAAIVFAGYIFLNLGLLAAFYPTLMAPAARKRGAQ